MMHFNIYNVKRSSATGMVINLRSLLGCQSDIVFGRKNEA
jgi:hypothetical protein